MDGGAVTVLVGTTKGAFLIDGAAGWKVRGPFCGGWPINHVIGDPGTGDLWAGGGSEWTGAGVWRSADGGATWEVARLSSGQMDAWMEADPDTARAIGFEPLPKGAFDGEVDAVWSLARGNGTLYAGAKPANLYASTDGGATWARVEGLAAHPSRGEWNPGAAGLVLHTILADPDVPERLWIGISAAGVFATEDGGATWERRNRRSNADVAEGRVPHTGHPAEGSEDEIGHCVHNIGRAGNGVLYQQNHHGVYRSADGGRSWRNVTQNLPSTFGFPVGVHPADPDTAWVLPLNGDAAGRYPPDAAAAVWKTTDGGESWSARRTGLPQEACFFTVLRQAMAVDGDASVYFGTNTGSVFASRDAGDTWDEIARHLPAVLSVETLARA